MKYLTSKTWSIYFRWRHYYIVLFLPISNADSKYKFNFQRVVPIIIAAWVPHSCLSCTADSWLLRTSSTHHRSGISLLMGWYAKCLLFFVGTYISVKLTFSPPIFLQFFGLSPKAVLSDIMDAGQHFCEENWSNIRKRYSSLADEDILHYCFSSAYIVALLHDSLDIALDDRR